MKKIKSSLLTLLISSSLFATEVYTLDDLILKALENSPDIKISSAEFESSSLKTDISKSRYLPKIDLHLNAGGFGQTDISSSDDIVSNSILLGTLSIKQIIYDFGKTQAIVDSSQHLSTSLDMNYQQIISDKKLAIKLAYYDILKTNALIDVQKENLKLNEAQLYRAKRYFEAGIRTKIDISDAKVEVIKAKIALKNEKYNLMTIYASLNKELGFVDAESDYKVYSKELDLQKINISLSDFQFNLADSINYAYENRYELKKYKAILESNKAQTQSVKSEFFPDIYFGADYTKQNVDKFKNSIPKDKYQASINLSWNIYQGGSTSSSLEEKKVQINIADAKLQNSKLSIKEKTTQAFVNLRKTKDNIELSQSLVDASKEKFNQASKRYENGLSDHIELQKSRQGYIDSISSLVVSCYNYNQAICYLDNAIGK